MDLYSISLFFHITAVLGIFVALSLEWTGLRQLRSAMGPERVFEWMGILQSTRKMGFAAMLVAFITGTYMTAAEWRGAAWVYVTLAALVLLILFSLLLSGPRMAAIRQALAAAKGSLPTDFQRLAGHPNLWVSIQTRTAIALGIVLLKIVKPDLAWSLLIILAAIILGLASAIPVARREGAGRASAE